MGSDKAILPKGLKQSPMAHFLSPLLSWDTFYQLFSYCVGSAIQNLNYAVQHELYVDE